MDARAMLRQQLGGTDDAHGRTSETRTPGNRSLSRAERRSASGAEDRPQEQLAAPAAPKQSASSYWSVPEQSDFVRYIQYFGRDFAAIAAHMGTKTQTMLRNHYQRQIDGGDPGELERTALAAEARRARGEDIGPPPIPTPIVKRKYASPFHAQDTEASSQEASTASTANRSGRGGEQDLLAMPVRCKSISDDATNEASQAQQAAMLRRALLGPRS